MATRRLRWTFRIVAIALALAAVEGFLQIARGLSPPLDAVLRYPRPVVADALVGHRPSPDHVGHDARGFRNPAVPEQADIVVLGDSQTYGWGLRPEEAWPRVLESRLNATVYSIAFGGYGPAHEFALLPEGLERRPRLVIATIYSGNDLGDAYRIVVQQGKAPELADAIPPGLLAAAGELPPLPSIDVHATEAPHGLLGFLRRRSSLWGVARAVKREVGLTPTHSASELDWDEAVRRAGGADSPNVLATPGARTVLTARRRLRAMDRTDPRVAAGYQIALAAMERMRDMSRDAGAAFAVVLIPTKEFALASLVHGTQAHDPTFERLIEVESTLWSDVESELRARSILAIRTDEALRGVLSREAMPYWHTSDGHPNATGAEGIGLAVAEVLETELGFSAR